MNNNRVTPAEIDALLDAAQTQEHIFWDKELVVSYLLPSGFTVTGRGACIDPANFDLEIGRRVAREDAANKLWQLEGYRKQLELASPKTRAKFVCYSKEHNTQSPEYGELSLQAVQSGSPENEQFFNMTPSGHIRMGILNPSAFTVFEPGKEYYVDFTPA